MRNKCVQRRYIYVSERVVGRRRKVDASVAVFGGIRSGRCCEGKSASQWKDKILMWTCLGPVRSYGGQSTF